MSLRAAREWLANTEWSIALHESQYAYAIPLRTYLNVLKMTALLLAVMFTFTIRRSVTFAPDGRFSPASYKAVAITSIALWSTVGWGGRWIGFS